MDRDEILDRYEDAWRQAALEDREHFGPPGYTIEGTTGYEACAVFGFNEGIADATKRLAVRWLCPTCGLSASTLAFALVHTNNSHRWTWLQLAGKFRDWLAEGERLAEVAK